MNLNVGMAKDILLFEHLQRPFYEDAANQFQKLLKEKFHIIGEQVKEQDGSLYQRGMSFQSESLENLWTAPEFISRILEYPYHTATQVYSFYIKAAEAEIARNTKAFDHNEYPYLWTASGDYFIRYNNEAKVFNDYTTFLLNDQIVLDFFSPNCIKIDGQELDDDPSSTITEYNYEEAFRIYEGLEDILGPLYTFPNSAIDMVATFTKVIILKKQESAGKSVFASASLYPHIGRSLLINVDKAHPSQVIDGLMHEAIHSLLYTIDALEKWMPSNSTINKLGPVIASPWTGRSLNLGNFCQAIFVWYGLFNFWHLAMQYNAYDKEYGEKRITTIRKGFEQVEIQLLNNKYNLQLNETFMHTVDTVKALVLREVLATTSLSNI